MLISIILIERTVPGFNALSDSLGKAFHARITTSTIDFPLTRSYRSSRKQFDASLLIREMLPFGGGGDVDIYLIREDIFADRLNFVFGLTKGRTSILSTHRLDPRFYGETDMRKAAALFKDRLAKEAIHEVGHAIGLPHCDDKKCVMTFSDSIGGVDAKGKELCENCRKALYLKSAGK